MLYQIALVTHIIGLTTMAGATLADFVMIRECWKQFTVHKSSAIILHEARSMFPVLFIAGIALLVLSGVTMMGMTRGTFGAQIWFKIKFILILLIIINAFVVRRRQGLALTRLVSAEIAGENLLMNVVKVRQGINWFYLSQITFFAIIFTLSVFKFN